MKFGGTQTATKNFFPLELIQKRLSGYYIDHDGVLYSSKRAMPLGLPVKLWGNGKGVYTLNGLSYRDISLLSTAKAHPRWKTEIYPDSDKIALPKNPEAKRSHATAVDEGIKMRGVVIAQVAVHEGQEHLLFGSKPAIHLSEASYKDEMQRLAISKPGTKFVAVKIVSSLVAGGLKWD